MMNTHIIITVQLRDPKVQTSSTRERVYPHGNEQVNERDVEVPLDMPAAQLADVLARAWLGDGSPIGWQIELESGQVLRPDETLAVANVWHGARITLLPGKTPRPAPARPIARLGPRRFRISPRVYPTLSREEIDIPPPRALPEMPKISWISVALPAGLVLIVALVVTLARASGNIPNLGNFVTILVSVGVAGFITPVNTAVRYWVDKRRYVKDSRSHDIHYENFIGERARELSAKSTQQRVEMLRTDPSLEQCLDRVTTLDPRLWERAPQDTDFLVVRLGLGKCPLLVHLKTPSQETQLEFNPLVEKAIELKERFSEVADVPILMPVPNAGAAGLVGSRAETLRAMQAMTMQLATHHAPSDVKLVALFNTSEATSWKWLRWLPHAWADGRERCYLADTPEQAKRLLDAILDALNRRKIQAGKEGLAAAATAPPPLPHFIILLGDPALYEDSPALPLLLREGQALGATAIFLAEGKHGLPRECHAYVEFELGRGRLTLTQRSATPIEFTPDGISLDKAETFARAMASVQLQSVAVPAEIPISVPLLDLIGDQRIDRIDIAAQWQMNKPFQTQSLAAPIGKSAGGVTRMLELHGKGGSARLGHGPHGLVAGTTGSGKSELLQTLIASFAARFDPMWVSFLLIDYKGGGMANPFARLPHLTGTITNLLDSYHSRRALIALDSEVKRRQSRFDAVGVNDIDEYQRQYALARNHWPAMPRLIIIVDEFAELTKEQPDFMRQLISASRVGRSLGIHLILATQKPSGVVNDQIWSNTRFHLCLRVEQESDSLDMLKRPDAASLTQVGRAYFQVGNNEIFEAFQAGYGGLDYAPDDTSLRDQVSQVELDGTRVPFKLNTFARVQSHLQKQLTVLVEHIGQAVQAQSRPALEPIWLEPLPERLERDEQAWPKWADATRSNDALGEPWLCPTVGKLDDPANRSQQWLKLDLGADGHLAIYGRPGSGKTTLLQSMIVSLTTTHTPDEMHLYLLDFGNRVLTIFGDMPQVGAVILSDEDERVRRLFRMLFQKMNERKKLFQQAGVAKLSDYNALHGSGIGGNVRERLPGLVIVIDNYPSFASAYEDADTVLIQIAREGAALGMHLVLTANASSNIKTRVSGNMALAVALQMAEKGDYNTVVGRTGGLEPLPMPGRGLVKLPLPAVPLEFQTVLPIVGETEAERITALRELAVHMDQAWGSRPRPDAVPVMREFEPLCELMPHTPGMMTNTSLSSEPLSPVPIGLRNDDLQPLMLSLSDGPHFIITGASQSGKTTLLQTWLLALAERHAAERVQFALSDFTQNEEGLYALRSLPHAQRFAFLDDEVKLVEALKQFEDQINGRKQAVDAAREAQQDLFDRAQFIARFPVLVLVLDEADGLIKQAKAETKTRLETVVQHGRGLGVHVLLAAADATLASSFDNWIKIIRERQTGVVMGSSSNQSSTITLRLSMGEANRPVPAGQGYVAMPRRGRPVRIKVATTREGEMTLTSWVRLLTRRTNQTTSTTSTT